MPPVTKQQAGTGNHFALPKGFLFLNRSAATQAEKLTPTEYMTLLMLIVLSPEHAGFRFAPNTRELATILNVSRRQVFRALDSLARKRYIKRWRGPSSSYYEFERLEYKLVNIGSGDRKSASFPTGARR
jgi:DNA-binding MarR family transcriptional regulator